MKDYKAIWDYREQPQEYVPSCNLCGHTLFIPLAGMGFADRYGFPQPADQCGRCGLVFLNPRMTKEAYAQFYATGAYRRLVSAFHGRRIDAQTIQPEQWFYAGEVGAFLRPHLPPQIDDLLDVGGSTGVVAEYLSNCFQSLHAAIVEPSDEADMVHTMEVIRGTAEDFDTEGYRYDLITLCQTVDHLLDISGTLRKLKSCLAEDGWLFVDAVDYDVTHEVKIDHPFNLTDKTMRAYLDRAELRIVATEQAKDGMHLRYLCQ